MALDIVNLVKEQLTPSVISAVAGKLGESENGVSKALNGLVPTIVGGLIDKKNESVSIFDNLKEVATSGVLSNLASSGEGSSVISSLLSKLFGNKLDGIISAIASFAGIKRNSASALMNLSSAATFGTIGKYIGDNKVAASGLSSLFGSQASGLMKYMPAGLSFASLGLGNFTNLFSNVSAPKVSTSTSSYSNEQKSGGSGWWKWLLGLILLGVIAFFLFRNCCGNGCKKGSLSDLKDSITSTVSDAIDSTKTAVTDAAQAIREKFTIDLDGLKLNAYKGGIEDQMITFIKSDDYKTATEDQLKDKWYSFDNIKFVFGKNDQLEEGSAEQLDNIAAILKKFPDAKVKIGGYTDKKGDEATNKKISQERADFLRSELAKRGVGDQIVGAEGYGEEFATVDENASDEERAVDRKMALRFDKE